MKKRKKNFPQKGKRRKENRKVELCLLCGFFASLRERFLTTRQPRDCRRPHRQPPRMEPRSVRETASRCRGHRQCRETHRDRGPAPDRPFHHVRSQRCDSIPCPFRPESTAP